MKLFLELIISGVVALILTPITLAVANSGFHQSWNFWPVFGIWFAILFIGFVWWEISDGEIDCCPCDDCF